MAVKHRKMGRKPGREALDALNEDLRETLALIQEEEAFDVETAPENPRNTAALEETFPALAGQKQMT